MNRGIGWVTASALLLLALTGCAGHEAGKTDTPGAGNTAADRLQEKPASSGTEMKQGEKSDPATNETVENSLAYYEPDLEIKQEAQEGKVVWMSGHVELVIEKSPKEVHALSVKTNGKTYPLKPEREPSSVEAMALSATGKFLAVDLFQNNVGHEVLVINLENGNQIHLNQLASGKKEGVETIHAYNWSPDGSILAYAYGDTSSSSIAAYDFEKETALNLAEDAPYISTAHILWSTDGEVIDAISEQPSDQFKLHRYSVKGGTVEEVADVKREELQRYNKYRPSAP
ncbi:hypothetical protein J25TS5_20390 [Paenibacillus faecis]|uniref:hypothetical protein n=1 Tax=Paenibacillus faecis TaxID=862114 RepID=UPI001B1274DA|nr:hypothetical protein [Paenibacillus faecis]GIO85107.1 hypothetical protein J25TS5_20390 [Paenibacillus faecis]